MLRLPNEILVSILRYLHHVDENWEVHGTRKDLLSARAACRRLANFGAPLAFRHVTVVQDEEGYQRLRELSKSNHRTYVRHLTYSFEDFSDNVVPVGEFDRYMRPTREYDDVMEKPEGIYEDHCRGSLYQSQLHDFNLDVAQLAVAFTLLDNLEAIRVSQTFTDRSGPWLGDTAVPLDCSEFLELPTSRRVLDTIAASLMAAGARLKALTLISQPLIEDNCAALTGLIQQLQLSKAALYRGAFGHLNCLSVFLPSVSVDSGINFEGLSGFICSLPELAELALTGAEHFFADLELPDLHASSEPPRLQSIQLSNVALPSPAELTDFLSQNSGSLRRVKLDDIILLDGSWEGVFSHMRDTLSLNLSEMGGSFYTGNAITVEIGHDMGNHNEKQVLPNRAIENFVEGLTDVRPFDLVRTYRRRFPLHDLPDDVVQCDAGVCPHYYTPEEAEKKLMQGRKRMTNDGLVYTLTHGDFYILGAIRCRRGRMIQGEALKRLAAGQDDDKMPQGVPYEDGVVVLKTKYSHG